MDHSLDWPESEDYAPAILVINLARRIHPFPLDEMLPIAFYLCCRITSFSLVRGLHLGPNVARLSSEDLETYIKGMCMMFRASSDVAVCFSPVSENLSGACLTTKSCVVALAQLTEDARSPGLFSNLDPIGNSDSLIKLLGHRADLCESCVRHVQRRSMEERHKVWCRLPRIFGIESLFTDDGLY